jgi:hypothetical protein
MREILTYGSVRGVPGNRHPYRDIIHKNALPPHPPLRLRRGGQGGEAGENIMKAYIQILVIIAFLFPLWSVHALSVADAPDLPRGAGERIMKGNALGGAFYENRGQIVDTEGKPRPEVLYYAQYSGARVYFTPTGWTYGVQRDRR